VPREKGRKPIKIRSLLSEFLGSGGAAERERARQDCAERAQRMQCPTAFSKNGRNAHHRPQSRPAGELDVQQLLTVIVRAELDKAKPELLHTLRVEANAIRREFQDEITAAVVEAVKSLVEERGL